MKIVSAALAYDDPMSGETVILRIHQAVHIPTMQNNLLCPMQLRVNDVEVNDCPKFLHPNPTETTHSIVIHEKDDSLIIPLSLKGVTSYFPTRIPTHQENETCRSFNLTFEDPTWDPSDETFERQEDAQVDSFGQVRESGTARGSTSYRILPLQHFMTPAPCPSETSTHNVPQFYSRLIRLWMIVYSLAC